MSNIYQENYEQRLLIAKMKDDFSSIVTKIVCIGGPLNDNVLKYTHKQLTIFSSILEIARQYEDNT